MTRSPLLCALLLAAGCGALPYERAGAPGQPSVELRAAPDVRVLALDVRAAPDGWTLAGQVALPQPVLAAEQTALIEGLDAGGTALFAQTVEVRLHAVPPRYARPQPASLRAALPAPAGLTQLRLTLPSGR